ncbi:hypothetical protein [Halobacillus mangrovi]|uniref:Uncharacterized protein n=1 Tax=Halobacillus mangrovi TaxID=402384 RepID=A0A1W5ZZT8_9BACI|nr:hypothetical protein [Halobacillus mangrovi]ARI78757.1 hypothetical protein HM131_18760 [Halobacillus mangrovi]
MNRTFLRFVVIASVVLLVAGCSDSSSDTSDGGGEESSSVTSEEDEGAVSKDKETILTYLENEFTGPTKELSQAYEKFYADGSNRDRSVLKSYIDDRYKPLVAKGDYPEFVNVGHALEWLGMAQRYGYELKPADIQIAKDQIEKNDASTYTFHVRVEYSKEGKTDSAMVTGNIHLNKNNRISLIGNVNDSDLRSGMLASVEN